MRRRDFIVGLGGAVVWPLAARGQQPERMGRVGVLLFSAENDPISRTRLAALQDGLQKLGWTEGVNLRIDYRFGAADPARLRSRAEELVHLAPDVIVAGSPQATRAVQQLTQTIPIVFVEATNEVGYGLTGNLARSEGNGPESLIYTWQSVSDGWSYSERRRPALSGLHFSLTPNSTVEVILPRSRRPLQHTT